MCDYSWKILCPLVYQYIWVACTYTLHRWLMMTSQSPISSTSNLQCGSGSLLMRICGTCEGRELGIRATGLTFRELPMTSNRSHSDLSRAIASWKVSGRPSPKKTMSGFMIPDDTRSLQIGRKISVPEKSKTEEFWGIVAYSNNFNILKYEGHFMKKTQNYPFPYYYVLHHEESWWWIRPCPLLYTADKKCPPLKFIADFSRVCLLF